MKRIAIVLVFVVTAITTVFAQNKKDYTTYDVVAKRGKISVIVKDNDWKMIVGNQSSPKKIFLLGNAKD